MNTCLSDTYLKGIASMVGKAHNVHPAVMEAMVNTILTENPNLTNEEVLRALSSYRYNKKFGTNITNDTKIIFNPNYANDSTISVHIDAGQVKYNRTTISLNNLILSALSIQNSTETVLSRVLSDNFRDTFMPSIFVDIVSQVGFENVSSRDPEEFYTKIANYIDSSIKNAGITVERLALVGDNSGSAHLVRKLIERGYLIEIRPIIHNGKMVRRETDNLKGGEEDYRDTYKEYIEAGAYTAPMSNKVRTKQTMLSEIASLLDKAYIFSGYTANHHGLPRTADSNGNPIDRASLYDSTVGNANMINLPTAIQKPSMNASDVTTFTVNGNELKLQGNEFHYKGKEYPAKVIASKSVSSATNYYILPDNLLNDLMVDLANTLPTGAKTFLFEDSGLPMVNDVDPSKISIESSVTDFLNPPSHIPTTPTRIYSGHNTKTLSSTLSHTQVIELSQALIPAVQDEVVRYADKVREAIRLHYAKLIDNASTPQEIARLARQEERALDSIDYSHPKFIQNLFSRNRYINDGNLSTLRDLVVETIKNAKETAVINEAGEVISSQIYTSRENMLRKLHPSKSDEWIEWYAITAIDAIHEMLNEVQDSMYEELAEYVIKEMALQEGYGGFIAYDKIATPTEALDSSDINFFENTEDTIEEEDEGTKNMLEDKTTLEAWDTANEHIKGVLSRAKEFYISGEPVLTDYGNAKHLGGAKALSILVKELHRYQTPEAMYEALKELNKRYKWIDYIINRIEIERSYQDEAIRNKTIASLFTAVRKRSVQFGVIDSNDNMVITNRQLGHRYLFNKWRSAIQSGASPHPKYNIFLKNGYINDEVVRSEEFENYWKEIAKGLRNDVLETDPSLYFKSYAEVLQLIGVPDITAEDLEVLYNENNSVKFIKLLDKNAGNAMSILDSKGKVKSRRKEYVINALTDYESRYLGLSKLLTPIVSRSDYRGSAIVNGEKRATYAIPNGIANTMDILSMRAGEYRTPEQFKAWANSFLGTLEHSELVMDHEGNLEVVLRESWLTEIEKILDRKEYNHFNLIALEADKQGRKFQDWSAKDRFIQELKLFEGGFKTEENNSTINTYDIDDYNAFGVSRDSKDRYDARGAKTFWTYYPVFNYSDASHQDFIIAPRYQYAYEARYSELNQEQYQDDIQHKLKSALSYEINRILLVTNDKFIDRAIGKTTLKDRGSHFVMFHHLENAVLAYDEDGAPYLEDRTSEDQVPFIKAFTDPSVLPSTVSSEDLEYLLYDAVDYFISKEIEVYAERVTSMGAYSEILEKGSYGRPDSTLGTTGSDVIKVLDKHLKAPEAKAEFAGLYRLARTNSQLGYNDELDRLVANGTVIEESLAKDLNGAIRERYFKGTIRWYVANYAWAMFNLKMLTTGDSANYSSVTEEQKRAKEVYSPNERVNTTVMRLRAEDTEATEVSVVAEDILLDAEDIKEVNALLGDGGFLSNLPEHQKAKMSEALTRNNATDGQTLRSASSYRDVMIASGRWSSQAEDLYQILLQNREIRKHNRKFPHDIREYVSVPVDLLTDTLSAMYSIKPFYFGHSRVETGVYFEGTDVPVVSNMSIQHKNSESPLLFLAELIPDSFSAKPYVLGIVDAINELDEQGKYVDAIHFKSAVKVGAPVKGYEIDRTLSREDSKKAFLDYVIDGETGNLNYKNLTRSPYKNYGIQTNNPQHFRNGKHGLGVQIKKMIHNDTPSEAIIRPTDKMAKEGVKGNVTGREMLERSQKLERQVKELGLHKYNEMLKNEDKLLQALIRASVRNADSFHPEILHKLKEAEFKDRAGKRATLNYLMNHPAHSVKIENLLNSMYRKMVSKHNIAGGHLTLVTDLGYEDQLKIEYNPNGSVKHVEVYMPAYDDNILSLMGDKGYISAEDLAKIDENLLKLVGYRVPTEDTYSMVPMKIKGFFHPSKGDIIMLPHAYINRAGWDMDNDKLYILRPTSKFKYIKGTNIVEGLVRDEYDDFYTATVDQLNNDLVEIYFNLLTSPHSTKKMLNPGGFESFVELAGTLEAIKSPLKKGVTSNELKEIATNFGKGNYKSGYKLTRPNLSPISPITSVYYSSINNVGQALISIMASANAIHASLIQGDVHLPYAISFNNKEFSNISKVAYFGDDVRTEEEYAKRIAEARQSTSSFNLVNLISRTFGEGVASAVDSAKDPVLEYLGITLENANSYTLMIRLGFNLGEIATLFNLPNIKGDGNIEVVRDQLASMNIKTQTNRMLKNEGTKGLTTARMFEAYKIYEQLANGATITPAEAVTLDYVFKASELLMDKLSEMSWSLRTTFQDLRMDKPYSTTKADIARQVVALIMGEYNNSIRAEGLPRLDYTMTKGQLASEFDNLPPMLRSMQTSVTYGVVEPLVSLSQFSLKATKGAINLARYVFDYYIQSKRLDEATIEKLFNDLPTYMSTKYQGANSFFTTGDVATNAERRKAMLRDFPEYFIKNITDLIKTNPSFDALSDIVIMDRINPLEPAPIPFLGLNETSGNMTAEAMGNISNALSILYTSHSPWRRRLAYDFVLYTFYLGGLSSRYNRLMNVIPVDLLNSIPYYGSLHTDAWEELNMESSLQAPNGISRNMERYVEQFILNNTDNEFLVPTKDISLIAKGGNTVTLMGDGKPINIHTSNADTRIDTIILSVKMKDGKVEGTAPYWYNDRVGILTKDSGGKASAVPYFKFTDGNNRYVWEIVLDEVGAGITTGEPKVVYKLTQGLGMSRISKQYEYGVDAKTMTSDFTSDKVMILETKGIDFDALQDGLDLGVEWDDISEVADKAPAPIMEIGPNMEVQENICK